MFLALVSVAPPPGGPSSVAIRSSGKLAGPSSRAVRSYLVERVRAVWGIAATKPGMRAHGRAFSVELRWPDAGRFEIEVQEGEAVLAKREIPCGDVHTAGASAWLLVKYAVARALRDGPKVQAAPVDDTPAIPEAVTEEELRLRREVRQQMWARESVPAPKDSAAPIESASSEEPAEGSTEKSANDPSPASEAETARALAVRSAPDSDQTAAAGSEGARLAIETAVAALRAEPRGASPEAGSGPGRMYGGAQDVRREPRGASPEARPGPGRTYGGAQDVRRDAVHAAASASAFDAALGAYDDAKGGAVMSAAVLRPEPVPTRAGPSFGAAFRLTLDDAASLPGLGPAASFAFGLGESWVAGFDVAYFRSTPKDTTTAALHHLPATGWLALSFGDSTTFAAGFYATADLKLASTEARSQAAVGVDVGPLLRLRVPLAGGFGFIARASAGYRVRRQQYYFPEASSEEGAFAAALETGVDFRWR